MADFVSEQDRIGAIEQLLSNPGWVHWLEPAIRGMAKNTMELLTAGKSNDDDIRRGWVQALRWVLKLPATEVEAFKNKEREASKHADAETEDEYRSRFGFRSPYKRTPEPGDTKLADDTTSAA